MTQIKTARIGTSIREAVNRTVKPMLNERSLSNPVDCSECPIRHRAVCARCESDELERLEEIKYYRKFEAGQTVIWSGDRMDFVGSVVSGIATLTQTMEDGRTQMVGLLLPSDFVGRPGRSSAAYDVVATTDLVMCCFRKAPFEDMMKRTPHIAQRLLEMTLDELDAAREWMLVLGRKTAREKIASLLAIIALLKDSDAVAPMSKEVIDLMLEPPVSADLRRLELDRLLTVAPYLIMQARGRVLPRAAERLLLLVQASIRQM